jgi:hypothetical protein
LLVADAGEVVVVDNVRRGWDEREERRLRTCFIDLQ